MKHILSLLLCASIFCTTGFAQKLPDNYHQYYTLANSARWNIHLKKYDEAIRLLNQANNIIPLQGKHVQEMIVANYLGSHPDSLKYWTNLILTKYGYKLSFVEHYTKLPGLDSILVNQYGVNEDSCYLIFLGRHLDNQELFFLEHYLHNDFFFRTHINRFNLGNCNDPRFTFKLALQYDSMYAEPFVNGLIKKYNFPNDADLGLYAMDILYSLLRHYNTPKQVLDSALVNGKIPPGEYASIVDYHYNWDFEAMSKPGFKGSIPPKNDYGLNINKLPDGTFILAEVDNIDSVDWRREQIGLLPLWKECKIKGHKLSDSYTAYLKRKKIETE